MMTDAPEVRDEYHALVRPDVLSLVPEGARNVLDVGGGIGASSAFLKTTGKVSSAVVIDLVADNCLPEIDAAYSGSLEDPALLEKVRQEQGGFDVILCLDVLEHLSDPWEIIRQCHSLLNPGGVIVASIPNIRNYRVLIPLIFQGRFNYAERGLLDKTHLRWFVRDTAIALMTSSGLKLDHAEGRYYGRKKDLLNKITLGLFRNFIYLQYFIRVRRDDAS